MPIPKPKPGENDATFLSRCVLDDTMRWEYPNRNQRLAVCYDVLRTEREEKRRIEDAKRPKD
jgi:hypothetical protein